MQKTPIETEINDFAEISDYMDLDQSLQQTNLPLKKRHYISVNLDKKANKKSKFLPMPPLAKEFAEKQIEFCLPNKYIAARQKSNLPVTTHEKLSIKNIEECCNFKIIRENIYSDSVNPIRSFDLHQCSCKPEYKCGNDCLNRMVYTECNPESCVAGQNCQNTKIQQNITASVEFFKTQNKGWGVKANELIEADTFIIEYTGEVISTSECKERMRTIYKNEGAQYCLHLEGSQVIDASQKGSVCRLVSHSCDPNCRMEKWFVNGTPRMALFATRDIQLGEELSFDYNFFHFDSRENERCLCESANCRGVIGRKSKHIKKKVLNQSLCIYIYVKIKPQFL